MARNVSRSATATLAAGVVGPLLIWCWPVSAEPSPGVPCLDLVQHLAAEPPSMPGSLEATANAIDAIVPAQPPTLPSIPVAEVAHGVAALAAPGPVPAPADVAAEAAPLLHASGVPPAAVGAPPVPAALPPVPAALPPVPVAAAPPVPVPAAPPAGLGAPVLPEALVAPPAPVVEAAPASETVVPESVPLPEPVVEAAAEVLDEHSASVAPEAAPVLHAAGGPGMVAAPGPGVPVVPAGVPVTAPAIPVPVIPLGDVIPALPWLPANLPMPTDLVCEGTAWSAGVREADRSPDAASPAPRRAQW